MKGCEDQLSSVIGRPALFLPNRFEQSHPSNLDTQDKRHSPLQETALVQTTRSNLESNVDISLEEAYESEAVSGLRQTTYPESFAEKMQESLSKDAELRVQKASPTQAQVFDSQLEATYSDELTQAKAREPHAPERLGAYAQSGGRKTG